MTNQLFVKMVLDAWNTQVLNTNKLLDALSDEQMQSEVTPGKNRAFYILGHLTAVNDNMLTVLDFAPPPIPPATRNLCT